MNTKVKIVHIKLMNLLKKYTNYNSLDLIILLSKYPKLYYSYFKYIDPRFPELAINRSTQLVIEGFPRSANTFAVVAFQYAQPVKVRVAHHLHVPAQVVRAVRWGIPTIVLIRHPKPAIASLIIRNPTLKIEQAFKWYISFYTTIYDYKSAYLIATFEKITQEFDAVIQRVNDKFCTSFVPLKPTEIDQQIIFDKINNIEPALEKKCTPDHRKSQMRKRVMQKLDNYEYLLKQATKIYHEFKKPNI